jgi:solute carrier family 25 S-adenosylmethionine transporter 26
MHASTLLALLLVALFIIPIMSEDELESIIMAEPPQVSFLNSLVAGGMAGTTVDVALFPIDTIKTRLQSPQGFQAAGGFRGIYNGLGAAALGSAPGAALFFSTYEVRTSYK